MNKKTSKYIFYASIAVSVLLLILMLAGIIDERVQLGIQLFCLFFIMAFMWSMRNREVAMIGNMIEICCITLVMLYVLLIYPNVELSLVIQGLVLLGFLVVYVLNKRIFMKKKEKKHSADEGLSEKRYFIFALGFLFFNYVEGAFREVAGARSFLFTAWLLFIVVYTLYDYLSIRNDKQI